MQPNQPPSPPPAPPPVNTTPQPTANPYDFLQPPQQKSKKPTILPTGNSTMQRLLVFLGLIVFLIIGFIVVRNFLSSAGKENTTNLVTVAQQQTELIRIADIGATKTKLGDTKNLALTIKLSLKADQPELLKAIKASGTKIESKTLGAAKDKKIDDQLTKAEQDNKFDEVFAQVITNKLGEYQSALKKAYDSATGKKLKESLNVDYQHINVIVGKEAK